MAYIAIGVFNDYSNFDDHGFVEIVVYHANDAFFGAIMAYLVAYCFLTEKFLKRGYLFTGFCLLVSAYFLAAFCRLSTVHLAEPLVRTPPFTQETPWEIFTDLKYIAFKYGPSVITAAFIFFIAKFFSDHSKEREKRLLLSKEKSDAELKMLRAQLNPHFLFNTLNNIYSLSVDNSPKTSSAIGKLSEILDYVLYKCNTDFVPVSSEMQLIEDYIELEKLRYDDRLEVQVSSSVLMENQVPPLIFLSLVENAFKHGAGEDSGSPKIWITLQSEKVQVVFSVVNTYVNSVENHTKESIGLVNINKQLQLLYGEMYSLVTEKENGLFSVTLVLKNKIQDEN
ncbi:histidine kinase [Flavobacterium amniphilum]|uniref:sensor histidine kinase n=1 Tax=Flavobacterium amniphilum TaxID=1834035 RepID=UPI00202ABDAA|nr:histidine kinase [Flavobacterium amniphilum]MCL9806874.1 histidine kinase [Flavobacterium amniphilum]